MGFCLILSTRDLFTACALMELVHEIPDAFIYYQPEERSASPLRNDRQSGHLPRDRTAEPRNLRADLFERTEYVVCRYLELAEEWNRGELQRKPKESGRLYAVQGIRSPAGRPAHNISAMIHPAVQGS